MECMCTSLTRPTFTPAMSPARLERERWRPYRRLYGLSTVPEIELC
jgi:hypothetical protein